MPTRSTTYLCLAIGALTLAASLAACALITPAATPAGARAEVEFRVIDGGLLKQGHRLRVTFADARGTRTLTPSDLREVQPGHAVAGPFATATSGDLQITAALVDQFDHELAGGTLALPLQPDRRYGIWVSLASGDPTAGCLGCAGSRSFPLDPALDYEPGLSLSIVWGSNSLSNPVVY